jgi:Spy/CpxP family protein refolding chaperone
MTLIRTIVTTAALAAALVITVPTAAFASTATGADYGQHVRGCAQTMGISGQHNPGMHHGFSGWDGMTCQA